MVKLTEARDIPKFLVLGGREVDQLIDDHDHLRLFYDLDELTQAACPFSRMSEIARERHSPLNRLILHFGDLVFDQSEDLFKDLVLHRLIAQQRRRICLDFDQEVVEAHVSKVLVGR